MDSKTGMTRLRETALGHPAQLGALVVGVASLLAAALGFTGNLGSLLSIDGTFASDNFLHLVSGSAAVLLGLLAGDVARRRVKVQGP
jgi:hypothetical protein